jgi:2-methylcitrate dehydratase PrpD
VHRRLGVREVAEETLRDPRVQSLMRHVRVHTTDTRCPLEPSFAYEDEVVLLLRNGKRLSSGPIRFARGHAQRPLVPGELEDKLFGSLNEGEQALGQAVLSRFTQMLQGA